MCHVFTSFILGTPHTTGTIVKRKNELKHDLIGFKGWGSDRRRRKRKKPLISILPPANTCANNPQ